MTPTSGTKVGEQPVKAAEPTYAELKAQLAAMEEANKSQGKAISFKVSEKGGVSVYGLGRFPVTLYQEQWVKLIAEIPALQAFIDAHRGELTLKADKPIANGKTIAADEKTYKLSAAEVADIDRLYAANKTVNPELAGTLMSIKVTNQKAKGVSFEQLRTVKDAVAAEAKAS